MDSQTKETNTAHVREDSKSAVHNEAACAVAEANCGERPFEQIAETNCGERPPGPLVGIVMGSDSDLPIMKEAFQVLESFGVPSEVIISSAHRAPELTAQYAKTAIERGLKVIIAGAGGAAHLPGVIAAMTALPVIGVPIKTATLGGLDSLYSIVQMPSGVPVATVGINAAKNAGILAAQVIATYDAQLRRSLEDYKESLNKKVRGKNRRLAEVGIDGYLEPERPGGGDCHDS